MKVTSLLHGFLQYFESKHCIREGIFGKQIDYISLGVYCRIKHTMKLRQNDETTLVILYIGRLYEDAVPAPLDEPFTIDLAMKKTEDVARQIYVPDLEHMHKAKRHYYYIAQVIGATILLEYVFDENENTEVSVLKNNPFLTYICMIYLYFQGKGLDLIL